MHTVERSVLVPHSASQMFNLVADVQKYPEFMPWCGGASVDKQDASGVQASITIAIAGLKHTFTTNNTHEFPSRIALSLVKGPFSALDGEWRFMPLAEDACKVLFTLRYEFSSRALEVVVGPVFNRIATSFIDSFTQRAAQCYGDGS
ncbi:type II toxin-antitoxin system RatA family toxin [Alcaligenaceae bacterium LF4-65]|jgi:ribosome-associated toxin RatA of RatAB toxin-antitoxin module|uniref:Type II toxin-antitoxin system RatA family toxin n=1 Tax=Zwartia hollandica TaxID=324606 RepID=A0A953N5X4_9BURK|nr:type II toxin-antitoxin system RatA family toxin [Zwartia hollandica]MBZ1349195.1 type II toxin-antitoxin system RatA family toxin [Zwartia hollandica]